MIDEPDHKVLSEFADDDQPQYLISEQIKRIMEEQEEEVEQFRKRNEDPG